MTWDDIDLDLEPAAESLRHRTSDDVDDLDIEILIDRITTGKAVTLSNAERDVMVQQLTARGHSLHQIAVLLGVAPRTVSRRRRAAPRCVKNCEASAGQINNSGTTGRAHRFPVSEAAPPSPVPPRPLATSRSVTTASV